MKISLLLFIYCVLFASLCYSQATIRGKITDHQGETVIGAAVVLKSNPSKGVITDFDGNYSLKIDTTQPVTLVVSFIGFQNIVQTVDPKKGEVLIFNFDLIPQNYNIGEVIIEAKADKAGDYYMEKVKKNSATSIDYISNETMRKVGDTQITSAVQRISGVSTVGGYVTVRGLADRYNVTSINGMRIPTLDPLTNNFDLNIFPTGLVDNVVITKTGISELPGDWSGAYISIETKDYPDKLSIQVSTSVGYNANATFQEITSTEKSKTDWLGWDDGFRGIPDNAPLDKNEFPQYTNGSNPYDQLRYLGLESYMNGYGITANTPLSSSFDGPGNAYYRLGLVELGLLPPAYFNSSEAYQSALQAYNSQYSRDFFAQNLNSRLSLIGQSFPQNVSAIEGEGGLNFSSSATIGNQTKIFGKTLGYNFGFRHSKVTRADQNAYLGRVASSGVEINETNEVVPDNFFNGGASQEQATLSALGNLSLKLNANNSFSILFMPNFLGINDARRLVGEVDQSNNIGLAYASGIQYEERKQLIYQYSSTHYIPSNKGQVNLNVAYTVGESNIPELIDFQLPFLIDQTSALLGTIMDSLEVQTTVDLTRRYRTLNETILHGKIDYEFPFFKEMESVLKIKIGGSYYYNERTTRQYVFPIAIPSGNYFYTYANGINASFSPEAYQISEGQSLHVKNATEIIDSFFSYKRVTSAYLMADYNLSPRLRLVGGLRVENTEIFSDVLDFYKQGITADAAPRNIVGRPKLIAPSEILQTNVLPSVNIIYKLRDNQQNPINLRLNYFASLARPNFKEISNVALFDYQFRTQLIGNPDLQIVQINNYDVRSEFYFANGNSVSVSVFYKDFKNHIELYQLNGGSLSWINQDNSYVVGLEMEGVYKFLPNLDFRGNITFIKSQTEATVPVAETRPMFGQAPYILNGILSYDWSRVGLLLSASYNVQGPKIAIIKPSGNTPNIYEMPRHLVDLKLAKNLGEHFNVSFRVRNLLNSPVRRSYDLAGLGLESRFNGLDFDRYAWGTDYILGLTYTL